MGYSVPAKFRFEGGLYLPEKGPETEGLLEEYLDSLRDGIDTNITDISSINTDISALDTRVDDLENKWVSYYHADGTSASTASSTGTWYTIGNATDTINRPTGWGTWRVNFQATVRVDVPDTTNISMASRMKADGGSEYGNGMAGRVVTRNATGATRPTDIICFYQPETTSSSITFNLDWQVISGTTSAQAVAYNINAVLLRVT